MSSHFDTAQLRISFQPGKIHSFSAIASNECPNPCLFRRISNDVQRSICESGGETLPPTNSAAKKLKWFVMLGEKLREWTVRVVFQVNWLCPGNRLTGLDHQDRILAPVRKIGPRQTRAFERRSRSDKCLVHREVIFTRAEGRTIATRHYLVEPQIVWTIPRLVELEFFMDICMFDEWQD